MGRKGRAIFLPNIYKDESKFLTAETLSVIVNDSYVGSNTIELDTSKIEDISVLTEDDILLYEAKELGPKIKLLNESWKKKQYCGYGIFVKYGGFIYEGMFNNNCINGFGMFISPDGKIKAGQYRNFTPKGDGEIYSKIEGQLKYILHRRKIDISCFIGEENIKKSQY